MQWRHNATVRCGSFPYLRPRHIHVKKGVGRDVVQRRTRRSLPSKKACEFALHSYMYFHVRSQRKVRSFLARFSWNSRLLDRIMCSMHYPISPESDNKCEKQGKNSGFQSSAAMYLRLSLFRDAMQFKIAWPTKIRPIGFPETSINNYYIHCVTSPKN